MKPILYMTVGLPASGKTWWSKDFQSKNPDVRRVNRDSLREMLDNGVWSKANETLVVNLRDMIVRNCLRTGVSVIVDDTNLVTVNWTRLRQMAIDFGAQFQPVLFTDVDLVACLERDDKREAKVGPVVINRMFKQLQRIKENGELAKLQDEAQIRVNELATELYEGKPVFKVNEKPAQVHVEAGGLYGTEVCTGIVRNSPGIGLYCERGLFCQVLGDPNWLKLHVNYVESARSLQQHEGLEIFPKQQGIIYSTLPKAVRYGEGFSTTTKQHNPGGGGLSAAVTPSVPSLGGACQPYQFDLALPNCVIFDIDGTLADMAGKRGPFEWHKVKGDVPRGHVVKLAWMARDYGYEVLFMSGRDGVCFQDTHDWLQDNGLHPVGKLFMRAKGDMRKDSIVKEELYNQHVKGKFNVVFVVDDRPQVIRKWKELGLNVLDVGNGKEF